jgi:hypothetical protein
LREYWEVKNVDNEEKENKVYLISTIIIFILLIISFCYFPKQFAGISSVICVFTIPFLPFYYLDEHRKYIKRITVENETYNGIQKYAEMLRDLSDDIENYNSEEYEESSIKYLEFVKDEIVSIAKNLKELRENDLFWNI